MPRDRAGAPRHRLAAIPLLPASGVTAQIEAMLPDWTLAPVVAALQTMRGMALVNAATLIAELGDLARFASRIRYGPANGRCPCRAAGPTASPRCRQLPRS
jgi:transposase